MGQYQFPAVCTEIGTVTKLCPVICAKKGRIMRRNSAVVSLGCQQQVRFVTDKLVLNHYANRALKPSWPFCITDKIISIFVYS